MSWLGNLINRSDNPGASTAPTRAVDTNYRPSTTQYVLGIYTVELVCTTGQSVTVELRTDSATTPTTPQCSAKLALDAGTTRHVLVGLIAKGDYLRLVKSGTGAASVISSTEIPLS